MVLCMNLNAAVDKTVVVDSFQLGRIHRPEVVQALPGGKGCNVARALQRLGETPVVSGWVGGMAGQWIENGLHQEGIDADFVYTDFESRTCLSILDDTTGMITEIYEKGAAVSPAEVAAMETRFRAIIGRFTAVTLSGSLPPGAPDDFYRTLIEIARAAGVPAFLDSSREALRQGAEARPFLIKPNQVEASLLAARPIHSVADAAAAAAVIAARYETRVLLSLGREGAIAAWNGEVVHIQMPPVEAKSAVGSGDCLLAGAVYGLIHHLPFVEAARYGVAAGTANALTIGAGVFSMKDFEQLRAGSETRFLGKTSFLQRT